MNQEHQLEVGAGEEYNPSEEERAYLRELRRKLHHAGVDIYSRDNYPALLRKRMAAKAKKAMKETL